MEAENYAVDKSRWERGPWDDEPDMEQSVTAAGFGGSIIRHRGHGALCGYVGVPSSHALYGKEYDGIESEIKVHGGLTYSGNGREQLGEDPARWYFGFDCAHSGDLCPAYDRGGDGIYCDIDYVRDEVAALSKQLAACAEVCRG